MRLFLLMVRWLTGAVFLTALLSGLPWMILRDRLAIKFDIDTNDMNVLLNEAIRRGARKDSLHIRCCRILDRSFHATWPLMAIWLVILLVQSLVGAI